MKLIEPPRRQGRNAFTLFFALFASWRFNRGFYLKSGFAALLTLCVLFPASLLAEHPLSAQLRARSLFRGQVDPGMKIRSMMFAFQPQNRAELERLLAGQQDPHSSDYRRWLRPREFGRRFGMPESEYQKVVQWLESNGFTISMQLENRLRIYFDGTARDVQRAFGVNMGWYELEGKSYYSNDLSPQVPDGLTGQFHGIYGLDNFPKERPLYQVGSRVSMAPADIQVAYNLTPLLADGIDGSGQSIAVVATSDFNLSDAQTFRRIFGLKQNDPQKFFVGSNPGIDSAGGGETEALIDLQWAGAVAPGAAIQVVIADNSNILSSLDYIVNRLFTTRVISVSFGNGETSLTASLTASQAASYLQYMDSYFMQAAAQGQTVLVSSGDSGAQQTIGPDRISTVADINYLCASGYVVCVGGTRLSVQFDRSGNAVQYLGETVWNTLGTPNGGATGGGRSRYVPKPSYQSGSGVPSDGARDVPDVAALADPRGPGVFIVANGAIDSSTWGGTSVSTPLWAGVIALVNQLGSPGGVGWANPRLYQLGRAQQESAGAPRVFNDVLIGNNTTPSVPGFSANAGFDLVTGWGSFNGDVLVRNFSPSSNSNPPRIVPMDGTSAVTGSMPPGNPALYQCLLHPTQYSVTVPADAIQLVVSLDGPAGGDVDLYARKGQPIGDTGFANPYIADYNSQGSTSHEALYLSPGSPNPMAPGTYYFAMANCASSSAAFTLSAAVITPSSAAKIEELSIDNGIADDYFNGGDAINYPPSGANGAIVVNRLRPTRYPSTLTKIRIFSTSWDSQDDPSGQQIRLVAFSDPAGTGAPAANPSLLVSQTARVPGSNGYMEYTIVNPPVIQSGDWYVGFQHPAGYRGVLASLNEGGVWRQAGFVSTDNGQSFSGPYQQANVYPPPLLLNANFLIRAVVQSNAQTSSRVDLGVPAGGAATSFTTMADPRLQAGYATASPSGGSAPFGTAVFSYSQNGVVLSEVGVPASPPTTKGLLFIDYWNGAVVNPNPADSGWISTNTGMALVNRGNAKSNLSFTLRDAAGASLAVGHATLAQNEHRAFFVDELSAVAPDFVLPASFPVATRYGTLEIRSDQPVSILALRLTVNRRGEPLLTSSAAADLTQTPSNEALLFPQFVDGGGYTTMVVLVNSATTVETGKLQLFQDNGSPLTVQQAGGIPGSSFSYSIPAGGVFVFQSGGQPADTRSGWVQVLPDPGSRVPVGTGIFSFSPGGILVTQSGAPSAARTQHARIYVDMTGGHDTGLALANPDVGSLEVVVKAYQMDGLTPAGSRPGLIRLAGNGHTAAFAAQLIAGLPSGFRGVLDISASSAFSALTLRSLINARDDFLLTTFPIADFSQIATAPLVFPQIADGGGYQTQIILLSSSSVPSTVTIAYLGNDGAPLALSKGN